jgi:hypothetical protein
MSIKIIESIDLSTVPKRNREWMKDEFFYRPITREALRSCADHYRDIAANNIICSDDERADFSRRARYLTGMATRLARSQRRSCH